MEPTYYQTDNSFIEDDFSIFTRPLKDLPILQSYELLSKVPSPSSQPNQRQDQKTPSSNQSKQNQESQRNQQEQRHQQTDALINKTFGQSPFEWLISFPMNALPEQEQQSQEDQEPIEDEKINQIMSFLDIDDLSFFSRDELQNKDEKTDFMISSTHLKELLSAPYNKEKPISLKVQKQGDTLKINRMSPLTGNQKGVQKHLKNDIDLVERIEMVQQQHQIEMYQRTKHNLWNDQWISQSSDSSSADQQFHGDLIKMTKFSANQLYQKMMDRGIMKKDHFFRKDFGRVLQLKLGNFKMLIGSNLLIFYKNMNYPISLKILQQEKKLNPLSCLDVWLDNVLHNIEQSAICYHKNGIVQEYKLIKTEEIPENPEKVNASQQQQNSESQSIFDPQVIKANGLNILNFLKSNCLKEGGTYWIFKDQDENQIQLYDLGSDDSEEEEEKKAQNTLDLNPNQNSYFALHGENRNNQPSFPISDYMIHQRRRAAQSVDNNDPIYRLQILDEQESFNSSNGLAYMYLSQAINLNNEAKSYESINQMRDYLLNKCKNELEKSFQKSEFQKQIYEMQQIQKSQSQNESIENKLENLQNLANVNSELGSQIQLDKIEEIKVKLENRLQKLRVNNMSKIEQSSLQPLSTKDHNFAINLCHLYRLQTQLSSDYNEIEFFKMMGQINFDDLKNQYEDFVQNQNSNGQAKIEAYHILMHVYLLQQKWLDAINIGFKLQEALDQKSNQSNCCTKLCTCSIIGFIHLKYATESFGNNELPLSQNAEFQRFVDTIKLEDAQEKQLKLLQNAEYFYKIALQSISQQDKKFQDYLKKLSVETAIINFRLCKMPNLSKQAFQNSFDSMIELLTKQETYELLLKLITDLLETIKLKVADPQEENITSLTSFVTKLTSSFKALFKVLKPKENVRPILKQIKYHYSKLILSFALILRRKELNLESLNLFIEQLFDQSIKILETSQNDQQKLDLAAANYHKGNFIIEQVQQNFEVKSDIKRLEAARNSLLLSLDYFQEKNLFIDQAKCINLILKHLIYKISQSQTFEATQLLNLEISDILQKQLYTLENLRKIKKDQLKKSNIQKHSSSSGNFTATNHYEEQIQRTIQVIDEQIGNSSNAFESIVQVLSEQINLIAIKNSLNKGKGFKQQDEIMKQTKDKLVQIENELQTNKSIEEKISKFLKTIKA
eukprot:403361184